MVRKRGRDPAGIDLLLTRAYTEGDVKIRRAIFRKLANLISKDKKVQQALLEKFDALYPQIYHIFKNKKVLKSWNRKIPNDEDK